MFTISKGVISKAQKVVIYGVEGIGKSTIASKFPNPLFIDLEGSTNNMDVTRLPSPSSWKMFLEEVKYVNANPSICKTLVIDTVDWAEKLCLEHICATHSINGIEDIGYGKGYVYLFEEIGRLLNSLSDLIDKGVNIVLLAHAQIRKFEQPDEMGAYDRWELKLQKKTAPLVKEWADLLLFANYKTIVINVDNQGATKGKNKAQGGKRVMYTQHTPSWDAKNRHYLKDELEFDYKAISHIFDKQEEAKEVVTKPVTPAPKQENKEAKKADENIDLNIPNNVIAEKIEEVKIEDNGLPRQLLDLMKINNITEKEIQKVAYDKGYYPIDTPIKNYDDAFINGWVIGYWDKVQEEVLKNRK